MTQPASLQRIEQTLSAMPHLRGVMLTTTRGEVLSSQGSEIAMLEQLASFVVGLSELSSRLIIESGSGEMESVFLTASQGCVCIQQVGADHLLFALCDESASPGLIAHELAWCAQHLHTTH